MYTNRGALETFSLVVPFFGSCLTISLCHGPTKIGEDEKETRRDHAFDSGDVARHSC